jgi:SNF2 family DNA or RNA helicase
LPEELLHRFGVVAGMGAAEDGHIRFSPGQAGLLDALLAAQPAIDCDEAFLRVRQQLDRFQVIEPAEQPRGFIGQLRGYQLDGMGWMHFLRQFSFGGCLADDMSPTKRH